MNDSMRGMEKMEEDMKIKEFMKNVVAPIIAVMLLMALFRPLCTQNRECNYLMLCFLAGIPIGLHQLFVWIIPKGYDLGGTMGILFLNLLVASVIGGMILTYRLMVAMAYLVKAAASGMICIVKNGCKEQ